MQSKGLNYTVKKGEYVSNWLTSDVIEIPGTSRPEWCRPYLKTITRAPVCDIPGSEQTRSVSWKTMFQASSIAQKYNCQLTDWIFSRKKDL